MSENIKDREFSLTISKEKYASASLCFARKVGGFRRFTLLFFAALFLVMYGSFHLISGGFDVLEFFVINIFLVLLGIVIFLYILKIRPDSIKANAEILFLVENKFLNNIKMVFGVDQLFTHATDKCDLHIVDSYADMLCCIETEEFFVLVKSQSNFTVIDKSCIDGDCIDDLTEFVRTTFARKYYYMKNIAF